MAYDYTVYHGRRPSRRHLQVNKNNVPCIVQGIFCGEKKIDIKTSLVKLKKLFGIDKMLLQGGPIIDGAFIDADCIDAISLIICPCTSEGGVTLFNPSKYVEFKLVECKEFPCSNVWLHYIKKK